MFQFSIRSFRRAIAARFVEPTFDHRRTFAGSHAFACRETRQEYLVIPAGMGWLVSVDTRYIGSCERYTDALDLIEADARAAIRHQLAA